MKITQAKKTIKNHLYANRRRKYIYKKRGKFKFFFKLRKHIFCKFLLQVLKHRNIVSIIGREEGCTVKYNPLPVYLELSSNTDSISF